jgi:glucose-6-phosphate 1-dehydrogenase
MSPSTSDAPVFFGATGDLAYKKIFPSLQAMLKRGRLDVPVVGVAKAGWNLDQLKARARQDYAEEAWRIVDPALKTGSPVFPYAPHTWGPKEVERVTPPGGWTDPVVQR